jgi:hypothetical protein
MEQYDEGIIKALQAGFTKDQIYKRFEEKGIEVNLPSYDEGKLLKAFDAGFDLQDIRNKEEKSFITAPIESELFVNPLETNIKLDKTGELAFRDTKTTIPTVGEGDIALSQAEHRLNETSSTVSRVLAQKEQIHTSLIDMALPEYKEKKQLALQEASKELIDSGVIDGWDINEKNEPVYYKMDPLLGKQTVPFESHFLDEIAASKMEILFGVGGGLLTKNPVLTSLSAGLGASIDTVINGGSAEQAIARGAKSTVEDFVIGKTLEAVLKPFSGQAKHIVEHATDDALRAIEVIQEAEKLGVTIFKSDLVDDATVKHLIQEAEKNVATSKVMQDIQVENKEALFKGIVDFLNTNSSSAPEVVLTELKQTLQSGDQKLKVTADAIYGKLVPLSEEIKVDFNNLVSGIKNVEDDIVSDKGLTRYHREITKLVNLDETGEVTAANIYDRYKRLYQDATHMIDKTESRDLITVANAMETYLDSVATDKFKATLKAGKAVVKERYRTYGYNGIVKNADVQAVAKVLNEPDTDKILSHIKTPRDAQAIKSLITPEQSNAIGLLQIREALDKATDYATVDASSTSVSLVKLSTELNKVDYAVLNTLVEPQLNTKLNALRDIVRVLKPHQAALENTNILGASGFTQNFINNIINLQFGSALQMLAGVALKRRTLKGVALAGDLQKVKLMLLKGMQSQPTSQEKKLGLMGDIAKWRQTKQNPAKLVDKLLDYKPTYKGDLYKGVNHADLEGLTVDNVFSEKNLSMFNKNIDTASGQGTVILKVPKTDLLGYDLGHLLNGKQGDEVVIPNKKFKLTPSEAKYKGRNIYLLNPIN